VVRRIEEASKFVPLENLAVSPQCGFASTMDGNLLTEDEQWSSWSWWLRRRGRCGETRPGGKTPVLLLLSGAPGCQDRRMNRR